MKIRIIFFAVLLLTILISCSDDDDKTITEYEKLIVGIFQPTDMFWSVKGERIYVFNEDKTGTVYVLESFDHETGKYTASTIFNISHYYIDRDPKNKGYNIIITLDAEWGTEQFGIKKLTQSGLENGVSRYIRVSKLKVVGVDS